MRAKSRSQPPQAGRSSNRHRDEDLAQHIADLNLVEISDDDDFIDDRPEDVTVLDDDDDEEEVQIDAGLLPRGAATHTGFSLHSAPPPGYSFLRPDRHEVSLTTGTVVDIDEHADVELMDRAELTSEAGGDFLRVRRIMTSPSGPTLLRGTLFRRCFKMDRMLRKAKNELCAILVDVDPSIANPELDDHLVEISLDDVLCNRSITLTNVPFAGYYRSKHWQDHSFRDHLMPSEIAEHSGTLCCRWKRVEHNDRQGKGGQAGALLALRCHEADRLKGIPNPALVHWWIEEESAGHGPSGLPSGAVMDLTGVGEDTDNRRKVSDRCVVRETVTVEDEQTTDVSGLTRKRHKRRSETKVTYEFQLASEPARKRKARMATGDVVEAMMSQQRTHADFLAGGGGATTGAQLAGSTIKFVLDKSLDACNTLKRAFPHATVLHEVLADFLHSHDKECYKVLTIHISYPCKTYSGAHTRDGRDNLLNEDAACSVTEIFRATRPKIATFEQTNAMVHYKKNYHVWRRLIRDITQSHYSLRWRVLDVLEYGNPSQRKRLIIMTACPGHPLPPFPESTHGPGKKAFVTVHKALSILRPTTYIEEHMRQSTPKDLPAYDPRQVHPHTITCDGGQGDLYPSGKRSFNMQELALLLGFPLWRRFAKATKTALRTMIGNAVPVALATSLYKMVHKGLDDGEAELVQWLSEAGLLDAVAARKGKGAGAQAHHAGQNEAAGYETVDISDDEGLRRAEETKKVVESREESMEHLKQEIIDLSLDDVPRPKKKTKVTITIDE
ncbi:hypothetical protein LTR53_002685 [Teratosphaeriaceae sp. CCFEE 6253]|nr:hypothetical protein LTR53_002685 [Teratosphaeriaceae sp. CCFEE 6253]